MRETCIVNGRPSLEQELEVDLEESRNAQRGLGLEGVGLTTQETTHVGVRPVAGRAGEPTLGDIPHDHQGPESLAVVQSHPSSESCLMSREQRTSMMVTASSIN